MAPRKGPKYVSAHSLEDAFHKLHLEPVGNIRRLMITSLFPRHAAAVFALVVAAKPRWELVNYTSVKKLAAADGTMTALSLAVLPALLRPPVEPETLALVKSFSSSLCSDAHGVGGEFWIAANRVATELRAFVRERTEHPGPEDDAYRLRVAALSASVAALQDVEYKLN